MSTLAHAGVDQDLQAVGGRGGLDPSTTSAKNGHMQVLHDHAEGVGAPSQVPGRGVGAVAQLGRRVDHDCVPRRAVGGS